MKFKSVFVSFAASLLLAFACGSAHAACVVGANGAAPAAVLTFAAVTANTDGTAASGVTYNLYQGSASGAEVKVATALVVGANTVTTGLAPNTAEYFKITASEGGVEGALSNEVCKSFPASVPGVVTITIS